MIEPAPSAADSRSGERRLTVLNGVSIASRVESRKNTPRTRRVR
jgi:hypothetical protein